MHVHDGTCGDGSHSDVQTQCPHCGRLNDAAQGADAGTVRDRLPKDGDLSVCWGCGGAAIFIVDEQGTRLRKATDDDLSDGDRESLRRYQAARAESHRPSEAVDLLRGA